ncbi:unnamed protein product [marine sediment metagenome]|uniref:Helix-turn-helix type 11 domain-containing protein n=1 Tax=marine sediment metagenome TaxID=412755 RepID=X0S011_9ZZZZ
MNVQQKKLKKLRRALKVERTVAQLREATKLDIHTIYKYIRALGQTEKIKTRKVGNARLFRLDETNSDGE